MMSTTIQGLLLTALLVTSVYCGVIKVPQKYELSQVHLYDCRWVCDDRGSHWDKFLECGINEVVGGTCGVERRENCDDETRCGDGVQGYAAIKCCKFEIIVEQNDPPVPRLS